METIGELRTKAKELGIKTSNTTTKVELQALIDAELGKEANLALQQDIVDQNKQESKVKVEEAKPEEPAIPAEIMPELEKLKARGLTWEIVLSEQKVLFKRDTVISATLKQSANNILMSARQAFAARTLSQEGVFSRNDKNLPAEWR